MLEYPNYSKNCTAATLVKEKSVLTHRERQLLRDLPQICDNQKYIPSKTTMLNTCTLMTNSDNQWYIKQRLDTAIVVLNKYSDSEQLDSEDH